ncbi:hypothetical protein ACODYM_29260 [Burkholderia gladioli]|uniref:hypothetical protein n=1 Tax=Burkholderia gladioli TaxID=28095 RepID=UPI003B5072CD
MAITVTGEISVQELLLHIDQNTRRRAVKAMIGAAEKIQETAIEMAPRDEANLEHAIKISGADDEQPRDQAGRFVKKEISVYVDTSMEVPSRPGKTVGDYAYDMHEHLTPYGPKRLGPESQEKQAANPGVTVGGGYLERALAQHSDEVFSDVARAVRD